MDKYRKFEFASLRNSKLTDGFWGKRTDNYMEIIQCMLEALLCPTNSARLINFEIAAGERKEWVQKREREGITCPTIPQSRLSP